MPERSKFRSLGVPLASICLLQALRCCHAWLCAMRLPLTQDRVLAKTSRLLPQTVFALYKVILAMYGIFWCIYWPAVKHFFVYKWVTFWTFYVGTVCEL